MILNAGWHAALPRGSLQGLAPRHGSSSLALGRKSRGISVQCLNVHAEHKGNLCKSRASGSIKEEPKAEAGSWGGACGAGGMWATPAFLSEPARAFLSLNQRADSGPEAFMCAGRGAGGSGSGCGAREGALLDGLGHKSATSYFLAKGRPFAGYAYLFYTRMLCTGTSEAPMLPFPEA